MEDEDLAIRFGGDLVRGAVQLGAVAARECIGSVVAGDDQLVDREGDLEPDGGEDLFVRLLHVGAGGGRQGGGHEDGVASMDGMLEPEPVADACLKAIEDETFLVLPHENVLNYFRNKAENYDRWIGGMKKLNRTYK